MRASRAEGIAEVAFLGRSNVGKLSLLNALVGEALARTSSTPGKTSAVSGGARRDHAQRARAFRGPAKGWAKVAKTDARPGQKLESYLGGRAPLRLAILLHDVRRDLTDEERDLLSHGSQRATCRPSSLADKWAERRAERVKQLVEGCQAIIATSAEKKDGIDVCGARSTTTRVHGPRSVRRRAGTEV